MATESEVAKTSREQLKDVESSEMLSEVRWQARQVLLRDGD